MLIRLSQTDFILLLIEEIINDPNRLEKLFEDTIKSIRNLRADLEARIIPIDERLIVAVNPKPPFKPVFQVACTT